MHNGIGRSVARVLGILALALFVALGVGTAYADPGGGNGDKPAQSENAKKPDSPPGQSGQAGQSGKSEQDVTEPQPPSNADFSGNGANTHGPYDSTRDGSASQNGNGDGKAVGKPCAGCVGKADNKNPKGQLPGGSDPNAGYECDSNSGVGKTNPAHTGCKATTPPPTTPPTTPPTEPPTPEPPITPPTPEPPGERPGDVPPGAAGEQPPAGGKTSSSSLPVTGVDAPSMLGVAGLLLAAGGLLLLATRRAAIRRN